MTPEEIEEIGRAAIICKMSDGDDLDRQDLQTILGLLCKDIQHSQFAKDIAQQASLPARIKGYKLKGQGRGTGSRIVWLKNQIAIDYENLKRDGMCRKEILKKLKGESISRYGRKLEYDILSKYVTEGRHNLRLE